MITHLITGGCSFSLGHDTHSWTGGLTSYFKNKNPELQTVHTANISQGQDLIQKRIICAAMSLIKKGVDPKQIFIAVMWSGTSRHAWYIDNPIIIEKMVKDWKNFKGGVGGQFVSLKDYTNLNHTHFFETMSAKGISYNPKGGWYFTVDGSDCKLPVIREYYLLDQHPNGIGKVHTSIENIVMLQNFCKKYGISIVQQFFMDSVYEDIENNKDNENINYLYEQLDFDTIIKKGQFEYALQLVSEKLTLEEWNKFSHKDRDQIQKCKRYFMEDNFHPNQDANDLWGSNILIPFIESKRL